MLISVEKAVPKCLLSTTFTAPQTFNQSVVAGPVLIVSAVHVW
jgi:hypothetical protein